MYCLCCVPLSLKLAWRAYRFIIKPLSLHSIELGYFHSCKGIHHSKKSSFISCVRFPYSLEPFTPMCNLYRSDHRLYVLPQGFTLYFFLSTLYSIYIFLTNALMSCPPLSPHQPGCLMALLKRIFTPHTKLVLRQESCCSTLTPAVYGNSSD